ncbi:MAG: cystathionine gamma-synthase [Chthoniobacteraceae bacterium]
MEFETLAIHDGQAPEPRTGAVSVPIYQTSTFQQDGIGKQRLGFEYSRSGNPTRQALEAALALVEHGQYGLAFSSGSAATVAALQVLKPGDQILAGNDTYGGTYRIFERILRPWGVDTTYVDATDIAAFENAITPKTKLVWIETPTNPLLKLVDIAALAAVADKHQLILVVDNTFASSYLQQPLDLGARVVVHSTTKYLGGHSDVVGGAFITSDKEIYDTVKFYQNAAGGVPGPWDSWLVLRGLKTLKVRVREHSANALHLARVLEKHPQVERVYYPGLESHPQHELAKRQMRDFGGMVSFEVKGGFPAVERLVERLHLFVLAESLGGVESLLCYPPRMTHAAVGAEERARRGIRDNLVRLSVGLEAAADLEADLLEALKP